MDVLVLPFIASNGNYQFETYIGDKPYVFDVRWNERDEAWYFDLSENDGRAIASGLKIVVGTHIGRTSRHELFSRGVFVAVDTEGNHRDATYDDLGTRVEVRYYPIEALAAAIFAT